MPSDRNERNGLGTEIARRLRLPGPAPGRLRPPRIGSVASSSIRFAQSLARPIPVRQLLQGPTIVSPRTMLSAPTRPPRWWVPAHALAGHSRFGRPAFVAADTLPRRGLPQAVHRIPDESSWTPGGLLDRLVSTAAPVRRLDEVVAAGPMLMSQDRAKLNARTPTGSPPSGDAESSPATAGPAPRTGGAPAGPPTPGMTALPRSDTPQPQLLRRAAAPAPPEPARTVAARSAAAAQPVEAAGAASAPDTGGGAQPAGDTGPPSDGARAVGSDQRSTGTAEPTGDNQPRAEPGTSVPPEAAPRAAWQGQRVSRFGTVVGVAAGSAAGGRLPTVATPATPQLPPGTRAAAAVVSRTTTAVPRDATTRAAPVAAMLHGGSAVAAALPRATTPRGIGTQAVVALVPVPARPRSAVATLRRMVGSQQAARPALRLAGATPSPVAIPPPREADSPAAAGGTGNLSRSSPNTPDGPGSHASEPTGPAAGIGAHLPSAPDQATRPAGTPGGTTAGPQTRPTLPLAQPDRAATAPTTPTAPTAPAGVTASSVPTGVAPNQPSRSSAVTTPVPNRSATHPAARSGPVGLSRSAESVGGALRGAPSSGQRISAPTGIGLATLRTLPGSRWAGTQVGPALRTGSLGTRMPASGSLVPVRTPGAGVLAVHGGGDGGPGRTAAPRALASIASPPGLATVGRQSAGPGRDTSTPAGSMPAARPVIAAPMTAASPGLLTMIDLLAATRSASHGATPGGPRALATAFSADLGAFEVATAGVMTGAWPARPDAPARSSPASPSRPTPSGPLGARPPAARSTSRPLLPAPPPVSIRRSPRTATSTGPPGTQRAGASAARAAPPAMPPGGTVRRSLVETTAHLFDADAATSTPADIRRLGDEMTSPQQSALSVVPPVDTSRTGVAQPDAARALLKDPRLLHDLVDAIVDRIERRVVDELERRGRRQNFGAF